MPRTIGNAHEPNGQYSRECPECGIVFRTDNHRIMYCSGDCQKKYQNRRYYEKHADAVKTRVIEYQRQKREE